MILLLLVICATFVFFYKIRWRREMSLIEKIPGPKVNFLSILGNLHQFAGSREKMWNVWRQLSRTYSTYRVWLFEEVIVVVGDPDDIGVVLANTKHLTKTPIYNFMKPWVGGGLVTSNGEKWHQRRRIIATAFHYDILNRCVDVFDDQAKKMISNLKHHQRDTHNLLPVFANFTLNTICETAMSTHLEDKSAIEKYGSALHELRGVIFPRSTSLLSRFDWIFALTSDGRIHARALKILHNFSETIIQKRIQYHEIFDDDDDEFDATMDEVRKKRTFLLDLLIQKWKQGEIDDRGIREEVDTFIFAGHDVVYTSMMFTCLLLAEHKDVQDRVRAEVNDIFQMSPGKLGTSELKSLGYMERCIKESLRLYPSIPLYGRITSEDLQLKNYLIPKDTMLGFWIYDLHRDPTYWPNPEAFDPDRFLPEACQHHHPYSYIPFSAGPRNCIGHKFAMLEMKTALAYLLHNFYLEPIDIAGDVQLKMDILLTPSQPIRMKFLPIN